MRQYRLNVSEEARETLAGLAAERTGHGVPRLKELDVASLTVGQPEADDLFLRGQKGTLLLAVSRRLMERFNGEAELVVDLTEAGEASFKLLRAPVEGRVQAGGVLQTHRARKRMGKLDYSGGETVRKLLYVIVGVAGVTFGVVAGLLFAPRRGAEAREEIVRRSRPLQDAARSTASRARQKIQPVVKLAGDRLPLGGRARGAAEAEGQAAEGGGEDDQIGGQNGNGATNSRHAEREKIVSIS